MLVILYGGPADGWETDYDDRDVMALRRLPGGEFRICSHEDSPLVRFFIPEFKRKHIYYRDSSYKNKFNYIDSR